MKLIQCACGCGEWLEEDDGHYRKRKYVNGHNNRKYSDPTQYKREWNHRNRGKRYSYKKRKTRERKIELVLQLGGKCQRCGYEFDGTNECCFDLHHKDPKQKRFALNQATLQNKAKADIKEEANKCMLLCATCHRLEHNNYGDADEDD